jgi:positive regulator of sigma E activity
MVATKEKEKGVIVGRTDTEVSVMIKAECIPSSSCASCNRSAGCARGVRPRRIRVPVSSFSTLTPGEEVTVEHTKINEAVAAVVVFGLPLIFAVAGYWVWMQLFPGSGESAGRVLLTLVGLVFGFIAGVMIDRSVADRLPPPHIVEPATRARK